MDLSEITCVNGMFLPLATTSKTSPHLKTESNKENYRVSYSHGKTAHLRSILSSEPRILVRVGEHTTYPPPRMSLWGWGVLFTLQLKAKYWEMIQDGQANECSVTWRRLTFMILPDLSTNQRSVLCPIHVWIKWNLKKLQKDWKQNKTLNTVWNNYSLLL